MKKEIWKSVDGYKGWYEVSNFGNVRSLDRVIINSDGRKRLFKGQIIKQATHTNGYYFISLSKSGKVKGALIHRLVAEAFIPNPHNLPEVNHRDENKANNCAENLEWCTHLYNMGYGTGSKRAAEKRKILFSKPVLQLDKNTNEVIAEYPSAMEATRQTGSSIGNISKCCNGKQKTYKGFKWRYKED